ncbi:SGNH/GDSL hydrolase family protein [Tellurirhabdus bombi]|uniref:SGNH/GDSL hydrolase family protein n=1 Tax=Tellurirhabdus bombi TaxID=2907205 RepID=UPI001F396259|nr:SGNH/GDSL hydrolase family protein [Tellurirhabdus bombi]
MTLEEFNAKVDQYLPSNITQAISATELRTILKVLGQELFGVADSLRGGWTPELALVVNGQNLVVQLKDWSGGTGNKPTSVPAYVGQNGYVTNIANAINIRGIQGLPGNKGDQGNKGWTPRHISEVDGSRIVFKLTGYVGGEGTAPTTDVGKYFGVNGYVTNIADALDYRGPIGSVTPELQTLLQNTQNAASVATQSKDLAMSAALNLTLSVEQMTASKTQTLANFSAFQFAGLETIEVRIIGTSILNNSNSAPKRFLASATKILGDSGNQTRHLGSTGGSLASLGWDYQVYGGHVFSRLASKAGSQPLKFQHNMKRYVLRYSKEVSGGTFEVWADGVLKQTVSCAGAQAYGQEVTLTWPSAGMHTVEIKNMVGTVYIESHDVCLDRPGLYIVDGSYGGSAINNYLTLKGKESNQIDGIAIQGWNGIDAAFGFNATIKPKVIFLHSLVNDAGRPASLFDQYYKPGIEYIVQRCNELAIQLIAVVEMGGHMSMPASGSYQNFQKHSQLLLDQRGKPNVTVLDWHGKSGMRTTDLVELDRLSKRYYSVTNLNVAAGTFAGDFIHPNNVGYAVELDMLHAATGLNFDGKQGEAFDVALLNNRPRTPLSLAAKLYAESFVGLTGVQRTQKNAYGAFCTYRNIGVSTHVATGEIEAAWASSEEINFLPDVNTTIAAGAVDTYGPYASFNFSNLGGSISNAVNNPAVFTITLVVGKGTASVRINTNSNSAVINQSIKGVVFTPAHAVTSGFSIKNESDTPIICHYTVEAIGGAFPLITLSATKLYGFYLTGTEHACIPGRALDKLRDMIPSAVVAGEIPVEKINIGQRYIESVNGKSVKSVAIGKEIYKPFQSGFFGLYRLQNTTEVDLREFTIVGTVVNNNYSEKYGSNLTTVDSNQAYAQASGTFNDTFAGKTFTLVGAIPGEATGISVQLYGNATYLGLRADGSWANDGGNHGTAPDVLANTRHYRGKTFAITFQMPPSELFAGANRVFRIYYKTGGGNHSWLDWALCEGSKATVY